MTARTLTPLRTLPMTRPAPASRADVEIYRPFFFAGILSVLTAGCALGAVALAGIALKGSYTASAWTPYVLAHANSQLYGWVGFFIIGFALQQHAPSLAKARLFHTLAYWTLGLLGVGIGLRFAAEPLARVAPSVWVPIGVFSCLLQVAGVLLFVVNLQATRHRTGRDLPWQGRFVMASLVWLILIAAAEPFVFAFSHQADPGASLRFVAEAFPAYREAQFLGFVSMMIFGVALTKLNSCFGAEEASRRPAMAGLLLWNAGLLARMGGWALYYRSGLQPGADRLYIAGGVLLAAAAVLLVSATRVFEGLREALPAHKFVRAAFGWLLVAGALLLLEPTHLARTGQQFSHAYTGAIRHAVTVGFISQMILGVGMHVVARMNSFGTGQVRPLWSAFLLINVGNAARVGLEIATDYSQAAFLPMGVTGFVELTGLSVWAWHVARPLLARHRSQPGSDNPGSTPAKRAVVTRDPAPV